MRGTLNLILVLLVLLVGLVATATSACVSPGAVRSDTANAPKDVGNGGGREVATAWAVAVATTLRDHLRDHLRAASLPRKELQASSVTLELEAVSLDGAVLEYSVAEAEGSPAVAEAAREAVSQFIAPQGKARLPRPSPTLVGYVDRYGLQIRFDGARLVGPDEPGADQPGSDEPGADEPKVNTPCGCRRKRR